MSLLLAAGAGLAAGASGPVIWVQAGAADFGRGDADGVSISSVGAVTLGPQRQVVVETGQSRVWSLAASPDGTVFVSSGESGEIHRTTSDGETTLLARLDAVSAQAMAWGPDGYLYVAAGPDAVIYRIDPAASPVEPEAWHTPGTRYVWALDFDADGMLWVGTGGDGRILRVSPSGEGSVIYDTPEAHVTALHVTPDGDAIAGTEGGGYIYRVSPDGGVFVLFDAPQREITDLLAIEGTVYAAAFGAPETDSETGTVTAGPTSRANGDAADKASGAVYRIAPDGLVTVLWTDDKQGPYALGMIDGTVVAGTGPLGRLVAVEDTGTSLLADFEEQQVVGLQPYGDDLLVATSNGGRVLRIAKQYRDRGELRSAVHDAGATSTWGTVRWSADQPEGTTLSIQTRSGNSGAPDDTWSAWSAGYSDPAGSAVQSPSARFVQWRAVLETRQPERSPVLRSVELAVVVRNLPPEITSLIVHPGGVVYRQNSGFDDGLPFAQVPPAVSRQIQTPGGTSVAASGSSFLGRPYYIAGLRTFTWQGSDPNDDEMAYQLRIRGEQEREFKPLAGDLSDGNYVLDTRRFPDGRYLIQVVVSDSPARAEGDVLEGRALSPSFLVDNTAPEFADVVANPEGAAPGAVAVRARVTDRTSLIQRLQYSVDGGDWRTVRPRDGVADAAAEELEVRLEGLSPGEHTVILRATDTAQNEATARAVVVVDEGTEMLHE
jgi:sugar lactone lactonase YvrE